MWSGALRAAGWPDERPVGTGSCPCQGFSLAGKGLGFDDPRHLFPDWLRLIDEAREQGQPWASTLFIEQVASAGEWLDLVQSSLEGRGFAFGYADLPAAGFAQGAHIRQRFYGVADLHDAERWADLAGGHFGDWPQAGRVEGYGQPGAGGAAGGVADGSFQRRRQKHANLGGLAERDRAQGFAAGLDSSRAAGWLGDDDDGGQPQQQELDGRPLGGPSRQTPRGLDALRSGQPDRLGHHHQGPPLGSWGPDERGAIRVEGPAAGASGSLLGCDWLLCHDARIRPVEPGTFPLAASYPGRVGALRLFGNGLDFEAATQFVSAFMEAAEIKG